jgi:hypothetical protein
MSRSPSKSFALAIFENSGWPQILELAIVGTVRDRR